VNPVTPAGPADDHSASAEPPHSLSAVVDALVRRGVAADLAVELVEDGFVVSLGEHIVVMGETEEALTGAQQVVVPLGADDILCDADLTERLCQLAARRHPDATVAVIRTAAGAPPVRLAPHGRARPLSTYLTIDRIPAARTDPEWSVRRYRGHDRDDVTELLVRALGAGYESAGLAVDHRRTETFAAELLDQAGAAVTVFCLEHRGEFAGHATVIWDTDELTGQTRPELLDMYVLEHHRGSPAAGLLTREAVRWSLAAGHPLRGHVSTSATGADGVLARLIRAGWRETESYWLVDLP
jgi:hypothetical protein